RGPRPAQDRTADLRRPGGRPAGRRPVPRRARARGRGLAGRPGGDPCRAGRRGLARGRGLRGRGVSGRRRPLRRRLPQHRAPPYFPPPVPTLTARCLMRSVAPSRVRPAALALLPALAVVVSCASAPNLPPKENPDDVAVYDPNIGQYPPSDYKTIGPIRVERPLGTSQAELIKALQEAAARLGADGIIVRRIGRSTEGAAAVDLTREERMGGEALALYYPPPPDTP